MRVGHDVNRPISSAHLAARGVLNWGNYKSQNLLKYSEDDRSDVLNAEHEYSSRGERIVGWWMLGVGYDFSEPRFDGHLTRVLNSSRMEANSSGRLSIGR